MRAQEPGFRVEERSMTMSGMAERTIILDGSAAPYNNLAIFADAWRMLVLHHGLLFAGLRRYQMMMNEMSHNSTAFDDGSAPRVITMAILADAHSDVVSLRNATMNDGLS